MLSVIHTSHNTHRRVILVRWRAHKSQRSDPSLNGTLLCWMDAMWYVSIIWHMIHFSNIWVVLVITVRLTRRWCQNICQLSECCNIVAIYYNDVIMSMMMSQITSLTIVDSTFYSDADQRKHQSSASLAFVREIHQWPVNAPHKGPATWKVVTFDDVIMIMGTRGKTTRSPKVTHHTQEQCLSIYCYMI